MEIFIPPCSSNDQISKDIYSFLYKQGNHIPISLTKSKNNNISQSGGGFYDDFSRFMNKITSNTEKEPSKNTNTNVNNNTNNNVNNNTNPNANENDANPNANPNANKNDVIKEENISTFVSNNNNNSIYLDFIGCSNNKEKEEKECTQKKYTLENIKGTKLYFLISRNGECARWV